MGYTLVIWILILINNMRVRKIISKHILDDFAEGLSEIAVVEKPAKVEGRSMTMVLAEKR